MARHKNSTLASLTYFIFFLPLLTGEKNDPFVRYHMKQAVGLLVTVLAFQGLIVYAFNVFESFGLANGMAWALRIFAVVWAILGFMNGQQGVEKPLPWIGKYSARL